MLIVHILLKYIDSMTMHWIIINNQDIFYSSCFLHADTFWVAWVLMIYWLSQRNIEYLKKVFFAFKAFLKIDKL